MFLALNSYLRLSCCRFSFFSEGHTSLDKKQQFNFWGEYFVCSEDCRHHEPLQIQQREAEGGLSVSHHGEGAVWVVWFHVTEDLDPPQTLESGVSSS